MRQESNIRVIYIPDCSGIASRDTLDACEMILRALHIAFTSDHKEIQAPLFDPLQPQRSLMNIFEAVALYCQTKQYQLYAIFDQHNALALKMATFPYCIPHLTLLNLSYWKRNCVVVLSASANNNYHFEPYKYQWEIIQINEGFSVEEARQWLEFNKIQDVDLAELEEATKFIPFELRRFQLLGGSVDVYKTRRRQELIEQQRSFCSVHADQSLERSQQALNAVVLMELGLTVGDTVVFLNQQQMYLDEEYIRAITPLAQSVLVNYWETPLPLQIIEKSRHVFTHPEAYKSAERGNAFEGVILNLF